MEIDNKALRIAAVFFVLVVVIVLLLIRSAVNGDRVEAAKQANTVLIELLKQEGYPRAYTGCRALSPGNYAGIEACLVEAKNARAFEALFEEDEFKNADPKKNATGYLIIRNERGGKSFASGNFTLRRDNAEIAKGCATPGTIAQGMVCRFDFTEICTPGVNLEILYDGKRAHLKTC